MRRGVTLVEILAVVAVLALMLAVAVPRVGKSLDTIGVNGAASDIVNAFAFARQVAIARMTYSTVHIDSARGAVYVSAQRDTILRRMLKSAHGVSVRSNRDSLSYDPIGHGYGASNQSIFITRGSAAETVLVSRLGRVRR